MLTLTEELYIAEGLIRKCYKHPTDNNVCVKICKPTTRAESRLKKELLYLTKIQKNKSTDVPYAKFLGEIDTNLGTGYLYDMVCDEKSNELSKTLEYYLNKKNSNVFNTILEKAICDLKEKMIKYKVFSNDLNARNICCKYLANGGIELIIVDGMGHRDFLPLADYIKYFAKKKVNRWFDKSDFYTSLAINCSGDY